MTSLPRSLGVLDLVRSAPGVSPPIPEVGQMLNPETFDFPVISEVVEGAWADRVIKGDPDLEAPYIAAARRLVERGAVAIASNCGYSIRHQAAVAAAVPVPVAMSSLLLIPTLLRFMPEGTTLAVITADSNHCHRELLALKDAVDDRRVVIGGIEGGTLWKNEMMRPPPVTLSSDLVPDVEDCVARLRKTTPHISAILMECTAFPLVSKAIQETTRLPIYDVNTLCRMVYSAAP